MAANHVSTWTAAQVATLTGLWLDGRPVNEIARYMGMTRGMVQGKAARIGLPPRNALASAIAGMRAKNAAKIGAMPVRGCRWPMWRNDERPTQKFCGEATQGDSSYCYAHHIRAYVGKPSRLPSVPYRG